MTIADPKSRRAGQPGVGLADPVDRRTRSAGAASDTCPSCDSPGSWIISRRHRFNPFGGVVMLVLAFWALVFGLVFGFGILPAAGLAVIGVLIVLARRTALVCQVCGFVEPGS